MFILFVVVSAIFMASFLSTIGDFIKKEDAKASMTLASITFAIMMWFVMATVVEAS